MPDLPVDIDTTYPDDADRPDRKLHQQHHDALHARYNEGAPDSLDGQTTSDFTALGVESQREPPGGAGTTLVGTGAGYGETGGNNTFIGADAGSSAESGQNNVAIGNQAGVTDDGIDDTVSIGYSSFVEGNRGIAIGYGANADTNGIAIGAFTAALEDQIALGGVAHTLFVHEIQTDAPTGAGLGGIFQVGSVATGALTIKVNGVLYTIAVVPV